MRYRTVARLKQLFVTPETDVCVIARTGSEDDETLDRHKNLYRRFRESLYEGRVMNRREITKPAVIIYQGDAAVNIEWLCLNPKKFITTRWKIR